MPRSAHQLRESMGAIQVVAHIFHQLPGLLQIINGCKILSMRASKKGYYVGWRKCINFLFQICNVVQVNPFRRNAMLQ
jgi:hypothetical protein